ncbi:hypothetical protein GCM10027093_04150 [Paraburkholderia jirisanensis]
MKNPASLLVDGATLIDAASNLVAQLDKHRVGGVMCLCIVALVVVGIVVIALALPLYAALTSRNEHRGKRSRTPADDCGQLYR